MTLFDNQIKAISHIRKWKVGALFMKMGTGKTRVALELVNSIKNLNLIVWVASLRTIKPIDNKIASIKDEIEKWGGFKADNVIYIGSETIGMSDVKYIQLLNTIQNAKNTFLIIDESIKIKNIEAKRTKRLLEISKFCEFKLILNGEPVTRDLLDLYSQINFLSPKILNMSISEFKDTFCCYTKITHRSAMGYKEYTKEFITGYENVDYLYSLIGQYVFECDLDMHIKQLYQETEYEIDEYSKKIYYELKNKYLNDEILLMKNNNIFLEITMKMQHCYCITEEKFNIVLKWFEKYPEEKSIIFCKYIISTEECKKRFPKATVLNYKTGSLGLNLQHLPYTVYFDKTFDYGDVVQSKYRNYRIGAIEDCRYLNLTGNIGLEKLIKKNNEKKIGISEYLKKISTEQLKKDL